MKLRRLVGAGAAAVGLAATGNRTLASRAGSLSSALPGRQHTYRWRGMDVSYTESGEPTDPDLLLVHGINAAASSHEFAAVVEDLAEEFHVIAPDLPGFGNSERPPLSYSGELYSAFLADFARDTVEDATCIASSLSGAYAVEAAADIDFERLVLVCPTARTMPTKRPRLRSLLRAPVVGTGLYNLIASKPSIRYFNADHGYYDMANLTDETLDYEWVSAHQPGARYAPASFISGFLDRPIDLGKELSDLDVPTTLVWGREADITPLRQGRTLAETADAKLVVIDRARLLPHVEHPREFVGVIREELRGSEDQ
ncbi:alpha/beta fold hydrolase [Halalkalicoccus subterraneus]|uniref:alpha/beta fold hydrolase n=1 Tax=Halalkalicoccus subterraneus TaxID=2675002 RepID=UPI000EFBF345|nr:alpha/beta hydrolase [Halalkalicoccus subterraneus]